MVSGSLFDCGSTADEDRDIRHYVNSSRSFHQFVYFALEHLRCGVNTEGQASPTVTSKRGVKGCQLRRALDQCHVPKSVRTSSLVNTFAPAVWRYLQLSEADSAHVGWRDLSLLGRNLLFFFGTVTMEHIQAVGEVTGVTIFCFSRSFNASLIFELSTTGTYTTRSMLYRIYVAVNSNVIFAGQFSDSFTEDFWILLD